MEKLQKKINNLYGINVSSFERVVRGFLSENYFLKDGQKKFFLKKYGFNNTKRVTEIHTSKRHFADGGIPVILPISLLDGNTFFTYDNSHYALFPFVDERQSERGFLTDTEIISLGKMLGQIHLLGKNTILPIEKKTKPWNKEKTLANIETIRLEINKKTTLTDFDKLALENINLKKHLMLSTSTTYEDLNLPNDHLIHGDYSDQNVFFNNSNEVSHVFDFDRTCYSPRMYEFFKSMTYSIMSSNINDGDIEKAKLYLNAYLEIYPTSKDEIVNGLRFFYIKAIHRVEIENENYIKNNNRLDRFLIDDFKKIQYLSSHLQEFVEKLLQ